MKYEESREMEYEEIRLSVFTPIFIGSNEKYEKYQYIYDNKKVYFLNETKWCEFLFKNQLLDQFVNDISKFGNRRNLKEWISQNQKLCGLYGDIKKGITYLLNHHILENGIPSYEVNKGNKANEVNNQIEKYIRDGCGNPYIPGSTLKGAFRTAILVHCLRHGDYEKIRQAAWRRFEQALQSRNAWKLKNEITDEIRKVENSIFGVKDNKYAESIMRGLIVSDAVFEKYSLCIAEKQLISYHAANQGKNPYGVSIFRECVDKDSEASFRVGIDRVGIDKEKLKKLGIYSFDDLLKQLVEFVQFQHDIFARVIKKNYQDELLDIDDGYVDMILGGGTGFINKTILYALAPNQRSAVSVVNALLEKEKRNQDTELAPRTLKLVYNAQNETFLMGLCRLKKGKKS